MWTAAEIPDQAGRTAVVTGANSGIGFETAKALAHSGAMVVLACRGLDRAEQAAARIRGGVPHADVGTLHLDLGSLASVRAAADELRSRCDRLDLLINNAGVLWTPYGHTADGFELQFGTNYLGHFALTGLLLDPLLASPAARVVTLSSLEHRKGHLDAPEPESRETYRRKDAYARSKLANLMFTYELQRRLARTGSRAIALAAHPGASRTGLFRHVPAIRFATGILRLPPIMQSAAMGALPTLRAAVDPGATGGQYYGPRGPGELTGYPVPVTSSPRAHDADAGQRLWADSERRTGVRYPA